MDSQAGPSNYIANVLNTRRKYMLLQEGIISRQAPIHSTMSLNLETTGTVAVISPAAREKGEFPELWQAVDLSVPLPTSARCLGAVGFQHEVNV